MVTLTFMLCFKSLTLSMIDCGVIEVYSDVNNKPAIIKWAKDTGAFVSLFNSKYEE